MMRYLAGRMVGVLVFFGVLAGSAWGEIPLAEPLENVAWENRKDAIWKIESARLALSMGMRDVAILEVDEVLALKEGVSELQREAALLIKADALLASGEVDRAAAIFEGLEGMEASDIAILRQAMIDFSRRDRDGVESKLDDVDLENVAPGGDVAWWSFLQGWVKLDRGREDDAEGYFETARKAAAGSPRLKAQLAYLEFSLKIESGKKLDREDLETAYERSAGTETGYGYARQLAYVLAKEGELDAAIALLERELRNLPDAYREIRDGLLLMELVIGGVDRVEGQDAARRLFSIGRDERLMQAGLQHVVSRCMGQSPELEGFLRGVLDSIIAGSDHTLLAEAYYYRGALNFFTGAFDAADKDALKFEELFPESPFRRGVYALRASTAWRDNRFRTAASNLSRLRSDYKERYGSTALAALIADCYFRAGKQGNSTEDYRNAAEAYANAISSMERSVEAGETYYQLTLSYLRSGDIENARRAVDSPDLRRLASSKFLWRAEWMLLEGMRRTENFAQAYQRIQIDVNAAQDDDELQLRFLWMGTKLSLEAGEPDETEEWVARFDSFLSGLPEGTFDEQLIGEARSSVLLTQADALFAIDEADDAIRILNTLRDEYTDFEPAKYSYIIEARYLSRESRTVEAQQLLQYLADTYSDNRLAPMALYEAALNAERRGQDQMLEQASKLLTRIIEDYPDSEMVFHAYLKQADLLRKLNQFGAAQTVYELLELNYSDHPHLRKAQISLADTLIAQSVEDSGKFEAAISRLELLMDLESVDLNLRVEAGYKLGNAWRNAGERLKAKRALWTLYRLLDVDDYRIRLLDFKGRYWLSRTLFALGELEREDRNMDASKSFYERVVALNLPGAELAKPRIERAMSDAAN